MKSYKIYVLVATNYREREINVSQLCRNEQEVLDRVLKYYLWDENDVYSRWWCGTLCSVNKNQFSRLILNKSSVDDVFDELKEKHQKGVEGESNLKNIELSLKQFLKDIKTHWHLQIMEFEPLVE